MATTRKIKEAKDINSGELIYFKGHAKATYMSDGTTVEDAINNIEVSGGSSSGNGAYAEVNHGTSDTTFTLTPNTFHVWDEVTALDLSFGEETTGVANEFLFQFTSGSTATTLTLPDTIKWANDEVLTIEANMIYQVSILKGLASVLEFINPSIFPITLSVGDNGEAGIALYEYLYNNYGETTSTITEEIYNENVYDSIDKVEQIEYGTYNGTTGYWLDGYYFAKVNYCLQSSGHVVGYDEFGEMFN